MDLMHMDERNSFHQMIVATVCGYGSDENKAALQVKLPYMEDGQDLLEGVELLLPYGGAACGFLCRPEIGDQVMIIFTGESERRAIALGCIASSDSTIWKDCSDQNEQKQWTMKNGMKLSIWDEQDASRAELTCKDARMRLDEKEQQLQMKLKDCNVMIDGKNGAVKVDTDQELKLSCGQSSILLKKDGTIKIEGKNLQIKGMSLTSETQQDTKISGLKVILDAKMQAEVKGTSGVKISASGITELKGGLVKLG